MGHVGPCLTGLFSQSHMDFEMNRKNEEQPSLTEMTTTAIRLLNKNPRGFYLLVEGQLAACFVGGFIKMIILTAR